MIKWIVMDMDGTLLNSQKMISNKTRNALISAQQSGYRLILASGRPTSGMIHYAHLLKMDIYDGVVISYDGSFAMNVKNQEILFHQPISTELSKRILHHLKQFDVHPMIDKDDYMFVYDAFADHIQHESQVGCYKLCEVDDLETFCDFPLNKIIVSGDSKYLQQHYEAISKPFVNEVHAMFTAPYYYELNAFGIDKATALKHVIDLYGSQSAEVLAFGDSHNDMTMLAYAGVGVAMGNAVSELKDISDVITQTNDNDGIVEILKMYNIGIEQGD